MKPITLTDSQKELLANGNQVIYQGFRFITLSEVFIKSEETGEFFAMEKDEELPPYVTANLIGKIFKEQTELEKFVEYLEWNLPVLPMPRARVLVQGEEVLIFHTPEQKDTVMEVLISSPWINEGEVFPFKVRHYDISRYSEFQNKN